MNPTQLRAHYCEHIEEHEHLPSELKEKIKSLVKRHFKILDAEIGLIELAWRRNKV